MMLSDVEEIQLLSEINESSDFIALYKNGNYSVIKNVSVNLQDLSNFYLTLRKFNKIHSTLRY